MALDQKPTADERRAAWRKIALGVFVTGLAVLVAPMFGLQFRRAARAGAAAPYVGVMLMVVSGLIVGGVELSKRPGSGNWLKRGAFAAGGLVVMLVAVAVIAPLVSGRGGGGGGTGSGGAGGAQPSSASAGGQGSRTTTRSSAPTRNSAQRIDPDTHPLIASKRRQYGEERVWIIDVRGLEAAARMELAGRVREALRDIDVSGTERPFVHTLTSGRDRALFVVSPLDDPAVLVDVLGVDERALNRSKREIRYSG